MTGRIQKQIGFTVAAFAVVLAAIALANFNVRQGHSLFRSLSEPSVFVVFIGGILVFLTGVFQNTFTRAAQVLLFYVMGLLPGLDAVSGNLTSAIFIGFSLVLLIEYDLLKKWKIPKLVLFFSVYLFSIIYGFIRGGETPLIASIHTILGILLALFLFFIMIEIRTRKHREAEERLEYLVQDRTSALRQKVKETEDYRDRLQDLVDHKSKLIMELHHRTKNNMQLILSLMDLEKGKPDREKAVGTFEKTYNRIHAIALVHEYLYQSELLTRIELRSYIQTLLMDIWGKIHLTGLNITVDIHPEIQVSADNAVPIGIILNEVMTNSLTHAFEHCEEGNVTVETILEKESIIIRFHDDGCGMPALSDIDEKNTLGILLVTNLVKQLGGDYVHSVEEGTDWKFIIPRTAFTFL